MKKNISFKLLTLILALCMTLPLFAACEQNNGQETTASVDDPATEAPSSEAATQITTEAPTYIPTEASTTEAPVEAPTEASTTEAPTEAPTEASTTEAPTEAPTEASTTEAPTEAPTEASTTEAPTEAPTEASTTEATTAAIEIPTEEPTTEPPTDATTTEGSTEESTEDSDTESESGEITEETTTGAAPEETTEPETETVYTGPDCREIHEFEISPTEHRIDICIYCGYLGVKKEAHTYENGICTVCEYAPECGGVHEWTYDYATHSIASCEHCGNVGVEKESHVIIETVDAGKYTYTCEICKTELSTKEIGDGVMYISPYTLSLERDELPADEAECLIPSTHFNMSGEIFEIEDGVPYFGFTMGSRHADTSQWIWNRNDPKYIDSSSAHERYNFNIGKSNYLVFKMRTSDRSQVVQLLYGTYPDAKRTRLTLPVSASRDGEWATYIIDLSKTYPASHIATEETGEYDVDHLMFHITPFSNTKTLDFAYIAFVDGSWAELDALVDEEMAILVHGLDKHTIVNVSDGSLYIPDYVEAPTCSDGTLMLVTPDSTASLLSPGTIVFECPMCGEKKSVESEAPIDPALLGMPIVYMTDIEGQLKPLVNLQKPDGEIVVKYQYVSNNENIASFDCFSEIKIQGASSSGYAKKNFTVKFFKEFVDGAASGKNKVDLGWGKENKYCMKANYIDSTQARNIVAAQMFAQLVASRENITAGLENAPNYGLIDGYPVLVYINGIYHGIYTMNIPKDDWQFAMEGNAAAKEALLMADTWGEYVGLKTQVPDFVGIDGWADYGFEVEYASDEANADWIRVSFNKLIEVLNCGDPERIRAELPLHLDIEAAIDNFIYTNFINALDNRSKNILWATYDGEIWIPSMYDMDGTFGNYWNGQPVGTTQAEGYPENSNHCYPYIESNGSIKGLTNKMWEVLTFYYAEEVEARYAFLRQDILTVDNTRAVFERFFAKTHDIAYTSDIEKWDTDANKNKISYTYGHITRYNMYTSTEEHLERLDAFFLNLVKK